MVIADNCVVSIHYTLTDAAGKVLDRSETGEPMTYLHGGGNIVRGLEQALAGKQAGDKVSVTVAPEDGYGPRLDALVQQVPRRAFSGISNLKPGMRFQAET